MDTGENSDLVSTDCLASHFVAALRPRSVALAAGATVLPGLTGNVDIPAFTAGASFSWLAEDGGSPHTELYRHDPTDAKNGKPLCVHNATVDQTVLASG